MPRWISLLALCTLTVIGGVSGVWAETISAVAMHETVPSEAEPSVEGEEEAMESVLEAAPEIASVATPSSRAQAFVGGVAAPLVPPPR